MVTIQIRNQRGLTKIEDNRLDITDAGLKFVKRISDLGDISMVTSSYSWQMKFPKSTKNARFFQLAGMVAHQSAIPYRQIRVDVLDNGVPIARNALLNFTETDKEYKAHIQEGIVDFYEDIAVDTIGDVIDLTPLKHTRDVAAIKDSWTNAGPYKYLIASYNGPIDPVLGGVANDTTNLKVVGLQPSVSVQWLLDQLMNHYGWTYNGMPDLSDKWLTYPNAADGNAATQVALLENTGSQTYPYNNNVFGIGIPGFDNENADNQNTEVIVDWQNYSAVKILETSPNAIWRITLTLNGHFVGVIPSTKIPIRARLYRNATASLGPEQAAQVDQDLTVTYQGPLNVDDIISFRARTASGISALQLVLNSASFKVELIGVTSIDIAPFMKLKVKDFFKEVLIREAVAPQADAEARHIEFKTILERFTTTPIVDLSKAFIRRINEKYQIGKYAQNNFLRHKYEEDGDEYYDGNMLVNNKQLTIETDLYKSFTFAPRLEKATFESGATNFQVPILPMYDISVKEVAGGIEIDYKPLKQRYFYLTEKNSTVSLLLEGGVINNYPLAVIVGQVFSDVIVKYFELEENLSRVVVQEVELDLSPAEFWDLSLFNRFYLKQEAAMYVINSITYQTKGHCRATILKIH